MPASFRVLTTPSFDRDFRKIAKGSPTLEGALRQLANILGQDPYNRSARHPIKKLTDIQSDGQWRIRWRDYRLRYDIYGADVVLHSFRHRKEAY
ncbi:MAG: type II toxin-antitoxin system RelE/ParE family toxin [Candidatus Sulfotelmatobacter sp.]